MPGRMLDQRWVRAPEEGRDGLSTAYSPRYDGELIRARLGRFEGEMTTSLGAKGLCPSAGWVCYY